MCFHMNNLNSVYLINHIICWITVIMCSLYTCITILSQLIGKCRFTSFLKPCLDMQMRYYLINKFTNLHTFKEQKTEH